MEIKRFEINEETAKAAKIMNSFSDYRKNEATSSYNNYLADFESQVQEMINDARGEVTEEKLQAIEYYCNRYSAKVAKAINRENSIRSMMPSIMISGAGNFNVRKKEKQNKAQEKYWQEYGDLFSDNNYYIRKIHNILNNTTIYSNDDLAIEKLENKIADLEESQKLMKNVNAYYRKNKTLDGCEFLTSEEIEKIKDNMQYHYWYDVPFAPYTLTNNNANIKRNKQRLEEIKKLKERAEQKDEEKYPQIDGVRVEENGEDMRIRLFFEDIPSADVRDLLKKQGFKWSPRNSAWQRQLTTNGIWATKQVLFTLRNKGDKIA